MSCHPRARDLSGEQGRGLLAPKALAGVSTPGWGLGLLVHWVMDRRGPTAAGPSPGNVGGSLQGTCFLRVAVHVPFALLVGRHLLSTCFGPGTFVGIPAVHSPSPVGSHPWGEADTQVSTQVS